MGGGGGREEERERKGKKPGFLDQTLETIITFLWPPEQCSPLKPALIRQKDGGRAGLPFFHSPGLFFGMDRQSSKEAFPCTGWVCGDSSFLPPRVLEIAADLRPPRSRHLQIRQLGTRCPPSGLGARLWGDQYPTASRVCP